MDERRKFVRLNAAWPVKFKITGSSKSGERTRTLNVGLGGVRFYTNAVLEIGTILELELFIPADSLPVFSRGRVVWQGRVVWRRELPEKDKWPLEIGVEFVGMDSYDLERLKDYIDNRIKKEKG